MMLPLFSGGYTLIIGGLPMTEENIEDYKNRIAELEKQLEETKQDNDFTEIKQKYEEVIAEKDKEIQELNKTVDLTNKKVETTVNNLNDEVSQKLEQAEQLNQLQKNVDELLEEKAEITVDNYIQKGIIPPSKRDVAIKLCLKDNDTFLDLYRDAQPIMDTTPKRKSVPSGTAERIANYFKN
jgi:DNA repair exonuclease SbcCD ATPase subunit